MSRNPSETIEAYNPFFPERTDRLHAMLTNCGHGRTCDHAYIWDGRKRGGNELVIWQYTLRGLGRLRFGDVDYPVPPGRGFLVIVPENHCYSLPPESPEWEFLYVSIHGSELVRLAAEFRRQRGFLLPFSPDSPTVGAAQQLLADCRAGKINNRYLASAAAYRFMMALFAEAAPGGVHGNEEFLQKVHAYSLSHLAEPITVSDLAEAAGCSRWHFSRKFQQAEGRTPHDFIIDLKMRLAARLLQTTASSVKEIAARCGFDDVSYFCKVFKGVHAITPAGFRGGNSTSSAEK